MKRHTASTTHKSLGLALIPILMLSDPQTTVAAQPLSVREPAKISEVDIVSDLFISGGLYADAAQIPWQASLRIRKTGGTFLCGGTVIRAGWVLTAAHCLEDRQAPGATAEKPALVDMAKIDVRSGSLFVGSGGLEAQPTDRWLMDQRDPATRAFDIAILRVQTSGNAVPIAIDPGGIASGHETLTPGQSLRVSGYGKTELGNTSPRLKYVDIEYVRRSTCNSEESYDGQILNHMICAGPGADNGDACGGDSGGPLFIAGSPSHPKPLLVGIVSAGSQGCGEADIPGVYTQLANPDIAEWIATTLGSSA
jgi:secreted trypsin-like serine protease